jgi:protein FAM32A
MSHPVVLGGKLKLKGAPLPTKGEKKKKKRKESSSADSEEQEKKKQKLETESKTSSQQVNEQQINTIQCTDGSTQGQSFLQNSSTTNATTTGVTTTTTTSLDDSVAQPKALPTRRKTLAELNFERVQKERQREKVAKLAMKSHRQRIEEFNQHLASLTEHYDIPKVGPG